MQALAVTRRQFFGGIGLGLGSLALAEMQASAAPAPAPAPGPLAPKKPMLPQRAKEFLEGKRFAFIKGVPKMLGHQFKFQQHGQSGQWISELLPHLAAKVDDLCVIRSMVTDQFNHAPAQLYIHTGQPRFGYPSMGAWATYGLGSANRDLPGFVVLTSGGKVPDAGKRDSGADDPEDDPEETQTPAPPDAGPADTGPPPRVQPTTPKPVQGEVLITEVMYDPFANEPASEWIELHNAATSARTLSGLTIVDGGNRTHVIGPKMTIAAGAYVVLARNKAAAVAAKVPAAAIVYEYGAGLPDNAGVQLANSSSGAAYLRDGATTIAQADYGGWYSQSGGSSVQLDVLTYPASGQSASWCLSLNPWATGSDKGTPGAPSDCP